MKKFVCVHILFLITGITHAGSLYIEFYKMMEQSSRVVICTYVCVNDSGSFDNVNYFPMTHRLNVETSLKGSWNPGEQIVHIPSGHKHFRKGDRFVAFISEIGGFDFVGLPIDEKVTEIDDNTMIRCEGFYDFNAYMVGPGTLTIGQLKQYIREKKYDGMINGHLYCFSNQTLKMEKQDVFMEVSYTYKGKEEGTTDIKVNGMSWFNFPQKPYLELGSWASEIALKFQLGKYRSLVVVGKLNKKANNGIVDAYFWVQEPRELTFDELKEFMQNDNYENPYWELELKTIKSGTFTIELDKYSGRSGQLKGYYGRDLDISSIQSSDHYGWERHIAFEIDDHSNLYLLLGTTEVSDEELELTWGDLIRQIKIEGGKGKMVIRNKVEGKEDEHVDRYIDDFTLTYKRTLFALLNDGR